MSAATEWTHKAIEKLIDLYRQKPELWDPKDNTYHIKTKKHDAWTNISLDMEIDVDAVKSKINSLLSSYRREKGKIKKSTGTGKGREDIYISNWFAFKFFYFLSEKDTPNYTLNTEEMYAEETSQDNLQPPVDDANNQSELQSETQTTEQSIENVIEAPSQSNGNYTIAKRKIFVSPKKNPKRKMVTEDRRLSKAYNIIDSISSEPATSRDECSVYGEHVANKLRKLNERSRAILMHKINSSIFEAEMEVFNELHRYTYQNAYFSSNATSIVGTPLTSLIPPQSSTSQSVSIQGVM